MSFIIGEAGGLLKTGAPDGAVGEDGAPVGVPTRTRIGTGRTVVRRPRVGSFDSTRSVAENSPESGPPVARRTTFVLVAAAAVCASAKVYFEDNFDTDWADRWVVNPRYATLWPG